MKIPALLLFIAIATAAPAASKLNVLLLVADDLRAELGCLGDRQIISPNIDRLANRGRLFTRAYCQQAVCNPSRASFMSGLRPDTIQVWDLKASFRKLFPQHQTLPQLFKDNGYDTRCIGKIYHNTGNLGDPVSWSKPAVHHEGPHWADTVICPLSPHRNIGTFTTRAICRCRPPGFRRKIVRRSPCMIRVK
ncbi:MAG: sulfatase-like hydrolase/transferase [Verrucomicrobiia bacterium]